MPRECFTNIWKPILRYKPILRWLSLSLKTDRRKHQEKSMRESSHSLVLMPSMKHISSNSLNSKSRCVNMIEQGRSSSSALSISPNKKLRVFMNST